MEEININVFDYIFNFINEIEQQKIMKEVKKPINSKSNKNHQNMHLHYLKKNMESYLELDEDMIFV